jgi:hypothetical protein
LSITGRSDYYQPIARRLCAQPSGNFVAIDAREADVEHYCIGTEL